MTNMEKRNVLTALERYYNELENLIAAGSVSPKVRAEKLITECNIVNFKNLLNVECGKAAV